MRAHADRTERLARRGRWWASTAAASTPRDHALSNDAIETHASRGRSARTNTSASGVAGGKHFVSRTTVASTGRGERGQPDPPPTHRKDRSRARRRARRARARHRSRRRTAPAASRRRKREQVVGAMRLDLEAHVDNLPGEFVGGGRGTVERWLRLGGRREPMPHPDVRLDVHPDPGPHAQRSEHAREPRSRRRPGAASRSTPPSPQPGPRSASTRARAARISPPDALVDAHPRVEVRAIVPPPDDVALDRDQRVAVLERRAHRRDQVAKPMRRGRRRASHRSCARPDRSAAPVGQHADRERGEAVVRPAALERALEHVVPSRRQVARGAVPRERQRVQLRDQLAVVDQRRAGSPDARGRACASSACPSGCGA